jgi:hypothetical protein
MPYCVCPPLLVHRDLTVSPVSPVPPTTDYMATSEINIDWTQKGEPGEHYGRQSQSCGGAQK